MCFDSNLRRILCILDDLKTAVALGKIGVLSRTLPARVRPLSRNRAHLRPLSEREVIMEIPCEKQFVLVTGEMPWYDLGISLIQDCTIDVRGKARTTYINRHAGTPKTQARAHLEPGYKSVMLYWVRYRVMSTVGDPSRLGVDTNTFIMLLSTKPKTY